MNDSARAKPIHVVPLLEQIADGIGCSNRRLVEAAQTAHGTLAVKTAEVAVEIVMSSTAATAGVTGPGLGALTLFGVGTTHESQASKATITLQIVPIAIPDARAGGPPAANPGGSAPTKPPSADDDRSKTLESLRAALQALRERVELLSGMFNDKRALRTELDRIERLLAQGAADEASRALTELLARYPKLKT